MGTKLYLTLEATEELGELFGHEIEGCINPRMPDGTFELTATDQMVELLHGAMKPGETESDCVLRLVRKKKSDLKPGETMGTGELTCIKMFVPETNALGMEVLMLINKHPPNTRMGTLVQLICFMIAHSPENMRAEIYEAIIQAMSHALSRSDKQSSPRPRKETLQ